jgi:hypothetical protein
MSALVGRDGRWRHVDSKGNCLWPRTFHDDHGVTHAVLLDTNHTGGPILLCTWHRVHRTGVDEINKMLTCLSCIVKNPMMPEEDFDADGEEA